jgi:hypothetical protein
VRQSHPDRSRERLNPTGAPGANPRIGSRLLDVISPTWQLEADPANASEVEVRFVAEGPDRTRVELEHRHIDRHGPGWEAVHDGVDSGGGWPLYLSRYAALLSP